MIFTQFRHTVAHRLTHLSVKADFIFLFILGALSATAMAPLYFIPIIFLTIPVYFFLLNKSLTTKGIFWRAWIFNYGYFVAGLYWIAAAMFVDIANNWWAIPFAIGGLPIIMSMYPAIAAAIWHRLAWQGTPRLLSFVVLWGLAEWVRGWFLSGFPWNLWGYTWTPFLSILQSASIFGLYGLTFITLLAVFVPIMWCQHGRQTGAKIISILLIMFMTVLTTWGAGRVSKPLPTNDKAPVIRIVQPNIKQEAKWDEDKMRENVVKTWSLTLKSSENTPTIFIWPETTITLLNTWDVRLHEENIRNMIPQGSYLMAGVFDASVDAQNKPTFHNALGVYESSGKRVATYNKSHLVPFGEYLPFQELWPVRPVAFRNGGITPGNGVETLGGESVPAFSALICYEILFPGKIVHKGERPQWILNVTNDAWYGNSSGPYQHLGITQARAVEEGLPVVRAANTGISAIIDPLGRIVGRLELNETGVVDHALPAALQPTLYAQYGNKIFFGMLAFFWLLAWRWQRRTIKTLRHVS